LTGLASRAPVQVETLDRSHGNALAAWKDMGSPEPPSRAQAEALRDAARATRLETLTADADAERVS